MWMHGAWTTLLLACCAAAQQAPSSRELSDLNWMEHRELVPAKIATVLLPTGTIEAHGVINNGADGAAPLAITRRMAPKVNALVAPLVPYGVTGSLDAYAVEASRSARPPTAPMWATCSPGLRGTAFATSSSSTAMVGTPAGTRQPSFRPSTPSWCSRNGTATGWGKRWLSRGILARTIGGWRLGAIHYYSGGTPMGLGGAFSFPIVGNRVYITTYENWRNPTIQGHGGKGFDPAVDLYFQPRSFFPEQPRDRPGNMSKNNPKLRTEPSWNENISLAKTFQVTESARLDVRLEAFNLLNRVRFSSPDSNLNSISFGLVRSQANGPRDMQVGMKLYW